MRTDWTATISIANDLGDVSVAEWNSLVGSDHPHLSHGFLRALETCGCLGEHYGWWPRHVLVRDGGRLVAAAPLYLKDNSYGEFVFDWSWAHAYQRHGLDYYPKLVSASPYTPATGPKLLGDAHYHGALVETGTALARELGLSSVHWLFTPPSETETLRDQGLLVRTGCQFHWQNPGVDDFDALLALYRSERRKKIRRERRRVREQDIHFDRLDGHSATEYDWAHFQQLYAQVFDRKGGIPTLSLDFFLTLARELPDSVLLIRATRSGRPVAYAFCLVGSNSLYGRHWGCEQDFHSLHFETCYYQGLDFCLERGLARFEPGAQGEHKVWRGFLPVATASAHWIGDTQFRKSIAQFLALETEGMTDYLAEMRQRSPYRSEANDRC